MCVPMDYKAVDALRKFIIPQRLDGGRMEFPLFIVTGGKRFGADNFFAHDMRHRRHLPAFDLILAAARRPKFTHGFIRTLGVGGLVAKRQIVAFECQAQAVLMRAFSQPADIIFGKQFGERLIKVPPKPARNGLVTNCKW